MLHSPIPPLLKKKKSNDKISGWREGAYVICLDVCSILDPVPPEIWLEILIQIDWGRSAVTWLRTGYETVNKGWWQMAVHSESSGWVFLRRAASKRPASASRDLSSFLTGTCIIYKVIRASESMHSRLWVGRILHINKSEIASDQKNGRIQESPFSIDSFSEFSAAPSVVWKYCMENSRKKPFTIFKLCIIVSRVIKSCAMAVIQFHVLLSNLLKHIAIITAFCY